MKQNKKLNITTFDELLDSKYGKLGTKTRNTYEDGFKKFFKKEILKLTKYKKEGKFYVAYCPNIELSSYGNTITDAKKSFKEVLDIYLKTKRK